MCLSSEILDDRVSASVEGSQASCRGDGPWAAARWKQCTDTVLLFAASKDCIFLLKSETDQILRFYRSCFLLYRKSENLLNMLATREGEGGIKLQTVLLKTAWAAFVWTCKTQQLNASIVCRGKYANSKHISHQKPFQACHR